MIRLAELNALPVDGFVASLAGIFEHSSWVAERVVTQRPFATRDQLLEAMRAVVEQATAAEKLALIRAHPRLGVRGASRTTLTPASAGEQRRAGLEEATPAELTRLEELNGAYLHRFGFPFILAVRGHDPASILTQLERRLAAPEPEEVRTALEQIGLIAGFRLADLVGP
jgi:OHCU decarboxylase